MGGATAVATGDSHWTVPAGGPKRTSTVTVPRERDKSRRNKKKKEKENEEKMV